MQIFAMRSMASGAAFHRAYLHATQQAFLEAHEHAFAYFGGVFPLLRYDYVPGNVIILMCRPPLCAGPPANPDTLRRSGHISIRVRRAIPEVLARFAIQVFGEVPPMSLKAGDTLRGLPASS
jgi:hypothetical protein